MLDTLDCVASSVKKYFKKNKQKTSITRKSKIFVNRTMSFKFCQEKKCRHEKNSMSMSYEDCILRCSHMR